MALTSLLGDRLAPLTYSIGFLSAPPKRVARAVRWLYFRWPDAWRLLDPNTDDLINLLPESFFIHMALTIVGIYSVIVISVNLIVGVLNSCCK